MGTKNLGIYSIGVYLPPDIRKNDWWPRHIVDGWLEQRRKNFIRERQSDELAPTHAVARALEEMSTMRDDPFAGVRERRVRPAGMKASDMEVLAAEDAIARAGIDRREIDLVLTTSEGPDTLLVPNAALVHHRLGLHSNCIAASVDAVCNSFSIQLTMAESLVRTGRIRYALLVQSMTLASVCRTEDVFSPMFGDAATAVVVGPCDETHGLLAIQHETDGSQYHGLLIGHPDAPWYEVVPRVYVSNGKIARQMVVSIGDEGERVIQGALRTAGLDASDVSFIATHQGFPWIRPLVQELIGAPQASSCDTVAWTGSVGPANVPICFAFGEREGLIKPGSVLAALTGGAGSTYAGIVLRWGVK